MDVFRPTYRELSDDEKEAVANIKDAASDLYRLIEGNPDEVISGSKARQLALAKTKLEESVMWAVKAITG